MEKSYKYFFETKVPKNEVIISRTNLNGEITYVNDIFAQISGYEPQELIGKTHSIIRHPDMPKSIFQDLWETIKNEKIWKGYVKNRRKDGGYYWVYAEVSGVYKDGILVEYKSQRSPIKKDIKIKMQNEYDLKREQEEGMVRACGYISLAAFEKLQTFSKNSQISDDKYLENLIQKADL